MIYAARSCNPLPARGVEGVHYLTSNCLNSSFLLAGGMISFDVFPEGWDKRYCLDILDDERFDIIHFFGNETTPVSILYLDLLFNKRPGAMWD